MHILLEKYKSCYIIYSEKSNTNKEVKIICRWYEERDEEIITNDINTKIIMNRKDSKLESEQK